MYFNVVGKIRSERPFISPKFWTSRFLRSQNLCVLILLDFSFSKQKSYSHQTITYSISSRKICECVASKRLDPISAKGDRP